jgi:glucose-6-phosphate 1-dehydrogenase
MISRTIPVEDFDLVIFGGTGDLARRKILPGLYRRMHVGQMPRSVKIIGAARSDMNSSEFRDWVKAALLEFTKPEIQQADHIEEFLGLLHYVKVDALGDAGWKKLGKMLRKDVVQAFYFSVGPSLFGPIARRLTRFGVAGPEARIVVEKPFGHDLASAKALNAELSKCFSEKQIYRIDHYLGKETVQNLMAVRFANALFEPLWNSRHIDHVQITVAETLGVGGRGAYYDKSGAMRDMVQNHLMQLLCLTAMEPPNLFEANAVRDEKLKVIRALEHVPPSDLVRGQYGSDDKGPGYLEDAENPQSLTESFVALKVNIANWRWAGTPFYLRTGKRLRGRLSEIVIVFKSPPHSIFDDRDREHRSNELNIRLQPDEGMTMRVTIKEPGPGGMRLMDVPLDMTFADAVGDHGEAMPDAYERLVMDVIRGNQTLFMRGDEVEAAWSWADPIIAQWQERGDKPKNYDPGGSGPEDSLMLLHRDGRRWREINE